MSTADANVQDADTKRRENFPMDTFRYLEGKLQWLRKEVMAQAAELAEITDSNPEIYRVERRHIDGALLEVLRDIDELKRRLGVSSEK